MFHRGKQFPNKAGDKLLDSCVRMVTVRLEYERSGVSREVWLSVVQAPKHLEHDRRSCSLSLQELNSGTWTSWWFHVELVSCGDSFMIPTPQCLSGSKWKRILTRISRLWRVSSSLHGVVSF